MAEATVSAIDSFRSKFKEYSDLQTSLRDSRLKELTDESTKINKSNATVSRYQSDNFKSAVEKLNGYKVLVDQLLPFKTKIENVVDDVNTNKRNLETLKIEIEGAIAAAETAAIVKAAQEAKDAAAAEKLRQDAVNSIDARIQGLREHKETLGEQVKTLLTSKTESVVEISRNISDKMTEIDDKMKADYISQQTKDIAGNKQNSVTAFRELKFKKFDELKTTFQTESEQLQSNIDAVIESLEQSKNRDIPAMRDALSQANIPESSSSHAFQVGVAAFQVGVDALIAELGTKYKDIEESSAFMQQLTAAINGDLRVFEEENAKMKVIEDLVTKTNSEIDSKLASVNAIESEFKAKKEECNTLIGNLNDGSLSEFTKKNKALKLDSKLTQLYNISKRHSGEIDAAITSFTSKSTDELTQIHSRRNDQNIVSKVPQITQALEAKISKLKKRQEQLQEEYKKYDTIKKENQKVWSSRSPSPINASAVKDTAPTQMRMSPLIRRSKLPEDTEVKLKPVIPPKPPSKTAWTQDGMLTNAGAAASLSPPRMDADEESVVILPNRMRNYIYISQEKKGKPSVPILLIIPENVRSRSVSPKSVGSNGGNGGSIRNHYRRKQRGGANLPDVLPTDSKMYVINHSMNPGFSRLMSSLKSPHEILANNETAPGEFTENPIVTKLKTNGLVSEPVKAAAYYAQIKNEVIGDDNEKILSIGRRAVYYVNTENLVKVLDIALGTGTFYRNKYDDIWRFMAKIEGSTVVLRKLFGEINPKIIPVVLESQYKIVGWVNRTVNPLLKQLFDAFSLCPDSRRSVFLYKQTMNNGESKFRFMLNWVILLGFHSVNNGTSTLKNIAELINNIHETFLGWLIGRDKDTFHGMFDTKRNPIIVESIETYNDRVSKKIENDIKGDPTLLNIRSAIQTKICELGGQDMIVDEGELSDDYLDDDYQDESDTGSDTGSDSSDGENSVAAILAGPARKTRSMRNNSPPPPLQQGLLNPRIPALSKSNIPFTRKNGPAGGVALDFQKGPDIISHSPSPSAPVVPTLNLSKVPLYIRRQQLLDNLSSRSSGPTTIQSARNEGQGQGQGQRQSARTRPVFLTSRNRVAPISVSESTRGVQPKGVNQVMPSTSISPQHDTANKNKGDGKHSLPEYVGHEGIPQGIPDNGGPIFLNQKSLVPTPPKGTQISHRSIKNSKGKGGNRKKRTRKHKKYDPISNSNRPTRRRNIKPNSDSHHKYTRKQPRT